MKITKIYALIDSRLPNDIRYIGKTTQTLSRRLYNHISDSKKEDIDIIIVIGFILYY